MNAYKVREGYKVTNDYNLIGWALKFKYVVLIQSLGFVGFFFFKCGIWAGDFFLNKQKFIMCSRQR